MYRHFNPYPPTFYRGGNDDRFGFLVPFLTGAVVSAPFWFIAGNNKNQYYQQPMYYQPYYPPYYMPVYPQRPFSYR